jgi:hypothetical protein
LQPDEVDSRRRQSSRVWKLRDQMRVFGLVRRLQRALDFEEAGHVKRRAMASLRVIDALAVDDEQNAHLFGASRQRLIDQLVVRVANVVEQRQKLGHHLLAQRKAVLDLLDATEEEIEHAALLGSAPQSRDERRHGIDDNIDHAALNAHRFLACRCHLVDLV